MSNIFLKKGPDDDCFGPRAPSPLSPVSHNTRYVNSDHANTNKTDNMGVAVPELKQYDPRPSHITTVATHTRVHTSCKHAACAHTQCTYAMHASPWSGRGAAGCLPHLPQNFSLRSGVRGNDDAVFHELQSLRLSRIAAREGGCGGRLGRGACACSVTEASSLCVAAVLTRGHPPI